MKKIFIISLLFVTILYSCKDQLTPDIPESPHFVLFAYLITGKPVSASVTKSIPAFENNRELALVDSVIVKLYENGNIVDTLKKIDSVSFVSHISVKENNKYKIEIKDFQHVIPDLKSEEISVLTPPDIKRVDLDSLGKHTTVQDLLKVTIFFDEIKDYKYLGYSVRAFENTGRKGHKWPVLPAYECDVDNSGIWGYTISNVSCFDSMQKLEFETGNHNLQEIDTIKVNLCKLPDYTGDYMYLSRYNKVIYDPSYLSLLTADDNLSSNIIDGYGMILTISCSEKILVLK